MSKATKSHVSRDLDARLAIVLLAAFSVAWLMPTAPGLAQVNFLELPCPQCGQVPRNGKCGCPSDSDDCRRAREALSAAAAKNYDGRVGGYSRSDIAGFDCTYVQTLASLYTDFKTAAESRSEARAESQRRQREVEDQARKVREERERTARQEKDAEFWRSLAAQQEVSRNRIVEQRKRDDEERARRNEQWRRTRTEMEDEREANDRAWEWEHQARTAELEQAEAEFRERFLRGTSDGTRDTRDALGIAQDASERRQEGSSLPYGSPPPSRRFRSLGSAAVDAAADFASHPENVWGGVEPVEKALDNMETIWPSARRGSLLEPFGMIEDAVDYYDKKAARLDMYPGTVGAGSPSVRPIARQEQQARDAADLKRLLSPPIGVPDISPPARAADLLEGPGVSTPGQSARGLRSLLEPTGTVEPLGSKGGSIKNLLGPLPTPDEDQRREETRKLLDLLGPSSR